MTIESLWSVDSMVCLVRNINTTKFSAIFLSVIWEACIIESKTRCYEQESIIASKRGLYDQNSIIRDDIDFDV